MLIDHFWRKFLFLLFIPIYLFGQSSTYSTTLDFNGSDSYITIPSGINDLSFSSDMFTLEAWIKIENAPPSGSSSGNNTSLNRDYIFSKKNDWSFYVLNINGSLYLEGRFRRDYHGNWPEVRSSTTISTDTWYHVAFTNSKSDGRIRIYINGNLDNSKNWTSGGYGLTSTTNPIGIGASVWNGIDNPSNFFDGEMSDIRFWDSERTQSAINYYKNSTLNTNSTLKSYYKLNEGSGSTINDLSGNSITGTARGSYQWKSNDTTPPTVSLSSSPTNTVFSPQSQVSSVVTINATFSEAMAASPTISVKEIDYAKTINIADYSSNQIGILVSNNRFGDLTRDSQSLVGKKIKVLSSGVTYTLTSLNSQSDSWVYFSTSPDFTPGSSSSSGDVDVVFIGDQLVNNTPLNLSNSTSNTWSYSWPVSSTLNHVSLTVSGTDLAGNSYSGSESITFTIDNVKPLLNTFEASESDGIDNYIMTSSSSITFTAVFSEQMLNPRISIVKTSDQSEIVSSVMVQSGNLSENRWTFSWHPPNSFQTETVSISVKGEDLAGNPYDGQFENIKRVQGFLIDVDNINPTVGVMSSTLISTSTSTIILDFSEPINFSPSLTISGLVTNILMSPVTPTLFSSENISISDYGYNMIALGSNNWSTIFGNNISSAGLISYTIEIDGHDYQISGIESGNKNSSSFWWYFTTIPEYTPGYSLGGNKKIIFKAPNYSNHLRSWKADFNLSQIQSSTFSYSISGADLAGNQIQKSFLGLMNQGTLFHYDFSDTTTHNGQTLNDLSGNNNSGTIRGSNNVYYDGSENAFRFSGSSGNSGVAISNLNYVTGDTDQLENFTIEAKIKAQSESGTKQRIILSFDRSSVFRFSIGNDNNSFKSPAAGKLSLMFTNSDGTHDKYDAGFNGDLRDNQWHDVMIRFEANKQYGLNYYVDGVLTYSDPTVYAPISNHSTSETPRYGVVGNGSELSSPTGSTGPNDTFYGWIREIKMSHYTGSSTPTDILLSATSVTENVSDTFQVATLTASDNDMSDVHSFSLIDSNDSRDDDNGSFTISGTSLIINNSPDYETKSSYNIYINVNDGTNDFAKAFTVSITNINEAPSHIGLIKNPIIPTNGLILYLDASNSNSYPGNGNTWFDLSGQNAHAEATNLPLFGQNGAQINNFDFSSNNHGFNSVDISQEYRDLIVIKKYETGGGISTVFGHYNFQDDSFRINQNQVRVTSSIDTNDWQHGSTSDVFVNGSFITQDTNVLDQWVFVRTYRSNNTGFGNSFRYEISKGHGCGSRSYRGKINLILAYNRKLTNQEVQDIYLSLSPRISGTELSIDVSRTVSQTFIDEGVSIGTKVGTLTATDSDTNNLTFNLVSGNGVNDQHNSLFTVSGTQLLVAGNIDYETNPKLYINLQVSDIDNTLSRAIVIDVKDKTPPSVVLTDISTNRIKKNTDTVTITADFSEALISTPTFSITGIASNVLMTPTNSPTQWNYTWYVSSTLESKVVASATGTDLSGNQYSGSESITFRIDNTAPNVILTDNDSDNVVKNGDIVVISAGFSESLLTSPTIDIGQIVSGQPLSSSNPFNFNNYWNNNEPNSSCNSTGCNEDFGILGFSDSTSTNTQFGSLTFNDYGSGGDQVNWFVEYKGNATSHNGYTYVGSFRGTQYFISNTKTNDFETLFSQFENTNNSSNGNQLKLLNIETDDEYQYILSLFQNDGPVIQNYPFIFGLYQDKSSPNYSEPAGGWGWLNPEQTYSFSWNVSSTNDGQISANVSGKDLAGNDYTGNDSILFTIDNTNLQ
jgi:hypothetical protein